MVPASNAGDVLKVENLKVHFQTDGGLVQAVDGISFSVPENQTVCLVGESGCGKSVTAHSILRLVPSPPSVLAGGGIYWKGRDLTACGKDELNLIRTKEIGFVFQEPMSSLNPVYTVGAQISEALRAHEKLSRKQAIARAVALLDLVGIPNPAKRVHDYPHQFSGGMRQRVVIAMALSCQPALLIADEPTTALDVTIQAQILELLGTLRDSLGMSTLMITHDMGVVAETAHRVVVMYAGRIVEIAPTVEFFRNPLHPYSQGLIASIPDVDGARGRDRLASIPGDVPSLSPPPPGCRFAGRCDRVTERCRTVQPEMAVISGDHQVACFNL